MTSQHRRLSLFHRRISVHRVQDAKFGLGEVGSMKHPVQKGSCFLPISKLKQRANGERCVADPAKAIVPVQAAANAFGQRSSRRCNNGTRWSKGQQVNRKGAATA